MRVVSNTPPVSNLAIIERLDLLKVRYNEVRIPPAVAQELDALTHRGGASRIRTALSDGWLRIETPGSRFSGVASSLDAGESEAIALACSIKADVLLIDEKRGRVVARDLGLVVGGLLGELLHAKFHGRLPDLKSEIERLRHEAGFFIDQEIEQFLLSQAGE